MNTPSSLDQKLLKILETEFQASPKKIAEAVLRLSDFYIGFPDSPTPWHERWCQIAYLAYYLPLNFSRNQKIIERGNERNFFEGFENLIDYGSGLGAGSLPLTQIKNHFHVENSADAIRLHKKITNHGEWSMPKHISPNTLGIFSYSLTELESLPAWAFDCDGLMLVEPSTSEDGRPLLELREQLIGKGFFAWAPCPHQQGCPLYHHSNHDWCHDRVIFDQPQWFSEIEKYLPMKNRTLTMSYVLMKKTPPPASPARLVGDLRQEKGKSRILVCRGPEREFLTFMDRHWKNAPDLKRGDLINWPSKTEVKSNEIRVLP